jgi:hypothetical protein
MSLIGNLEFCDLGLGLVSYDRLNGLASLFKDL